MCKDMSRKLEDIIKAAHYGKQGTIVLINDRGEVEEVIPRINVLPKEK